MRHFIGIDLGGTNIAAGVVSEDGALLCKTSVPTGASRAAEEIVADMARAAQQCLAGSGFSPAQIDAVGVGVPGAVNDAEGMVLFTSNLDWRNLPLSDMLSGRLGQGGPFPHEVGLFLGYPPEDVEGFCRNGGRNYKLSGPWKVYGRVEEAKVRFETFRRCRDALYRHVEEGRTLAQLFPAA